jgi:YD repeat-containing protein
MTKLLVYVLLIGAGCCVAQESNNANSSGQCSPPVAGNNNTVTITCGIGVQRAREMQAILNKILANQLDSAAVIEKLNELLRRTNPNGAVVTYDCDGNSRTTTPGSTMAHVDLPRQNVQLMMNLSSANRASDLLKECLSEIQQKPEWLTPRLFCSNAYLALGDLAHARQMLDDYNASVGPAYTGDPLCRDLSSFLQSHLK